MSEALNKNMEKNIFPYWRNHASLKGTLKKFNINFRMVLHELSFDFNESFT